MTTTLIATRGLPGAGKSFRARRWVAEDPSGRARVGTDELTGMLHEPRSFYDEPDEPDEHDEAADLHATVALHGAIRALLTAGISVVCDDTNLLPQHLTALQSIAADCGATFELWDMTDVPVETCIDRDESRGINGEPWVGAKRIWQMHDQYLRHQPLTSRSPAAQPTPEKEPLMSQHDLASLAAVVGAAAPAPIPARIPAPVPDGTSTWAQRTEYDLWSSLFAHLLARREFGVRATSLDPQRGTFLWRDSVTDSLAMSELKAEALVSVLRGYAAGDDVERQRMGVSGAEVVFRWVAELPGGTTITSDWQPTTAPTPEGDADADA
ncbi:AAA family ATPase [Actinoplanes sp. URMC 104]|uniref:AAA family ATPase n=1 Tax=Actinoplanes sp. URMC 104 TaxID=3423409 RepID=UPI003F199DA1